MKIFTGKVPGNPHKGRGHTAFHNGQQSILNQCVEVDMDELLKEYEIYKSCVKPVAEAHGRKPEYMKLSQFIQSEIKKKEGKDE